MLTRRLLLAATAGALTATAARAAPARALTVYKTPTCGCCGGWVAHMRRNGFAATVIEQADLTPVRRRLGVPDAVVSCHTAVIDGYALEGHVPATDILRLLAERPQAAGLAVPGMPLGSPGMEVPDGTRDAFDTLLILRDGRTRVFARHR